MLLPLPRRFKGGADPAAMTGASWLALPLLPMILRIYTWNVQGLNALKGNNRDAYKILEDSGTLGPYDVLLLQEHKLLDLDIEFVSKRLKVGKSRWVAAKGNHKGGLAIILGERHEHYLLELGSDEKFGFMWVKLATATGEIGIVNAYAPQSPHDRALMWNRIQ